MTTPRPTPFPATTPCAGVLVPFVIIFYFDDEITTLPVRPAPPSLDRIPALFGYPLDSDDDSSDKDLSETAELLHTQTALTSVVHLLSTRPPPTSNAFACRPGKEISMPLGYKAAMDRSRASPPSTPHPLLPSEIPSSSSPPPRLVPSSSSPPPSLLPSSSRKRSRSPSPSLPPLVAPSPPAATVPPPLEHIESVGDDIETLRASLASAMQETMTLRARVGLVEQHDVVTQDSLRIARGRITRSQLRVEYAEQEVKELREQTGDRACTQRTVMTDLDIEASCNRAKAAEQRAETLHVSLGATQMDETITNKNQRMSFVKIEQIVAQQVANAIETIAIYKAKTRVARNLMNRVERKYDKVAKNDSNKRKWEGDHSGCSSQQQNKKHKVIRAFTARPSMKKGYIGNLPLCNKCKFYHTGLCTEKCGNYKWVGHQTRDCSPQSQEQNKGPQWHNRRLKLPVMSVEG
uniref:Reverse transcriptase domain-containing protein n=1 Tax=Tanacetum cinerariifolium TaxID=118510 RepID=A0A6L2JKI1_TANCI|nr:reverse transcriptase domain-containing protein [Tanacetum cinerariifolium]